MTWSRRITQCCAGAMGLLLFVLVVHAGESEMSASLLPTQASEFEQWAKLAERLGFCLVGFGILAYMMFRQSALEGITKRYNAS
ncbi:MAG: hypothetical protein Q8K78_00410 [Planctomycetaceae bacterium]|nr:hypothetical protein [Planctomycetaceae bacterium]